jgi:hypothetical protein
MGLVMQVSGKWIILGAFALAVAMSGGAWWYHYTQVRQAAAFWGPAGRLIVRGTDVTFYELGEPGSAPGEIAGRPIRSTKDLSREHGLVHLRHVFYLDSNFDWEGRDSEGGGDPQAGTTAWRYAIRFGDGEAEAYVLLTADFKRTGRWRGGDVVNVLPSPRIDDSLRRYLLDIGAIEKTGGPGGE